MGLLSTAFSFVKDNMPLLSSAYKAVSWVLEKESMAKSNVKEAAELWKMCKGLKPVLEQLSECDTLPDTLDPLLENINDDLQAAMDVVAKVYDSKCKIGEWLMADGERKQLERCVHSLQFSLNAMVPLVVGILGDQNAALDGLKGDVQEVKDLLMDMKIGAFHGGDMQGPVDTDHPMPSDIPKLVRLLAKGTESQQAAAAWALAKLCDNGLANIYLRIADAGAIAPLVDLLCYSEDDGVKFAALSAVTAVARGKQPKCLKAMVAAGAIDVLVRFLGAPSPAVSASVLLALDALYVEPAIGAIHERISAEEGAIDALVRLLSHEYEETQGRAAEFLRRLSAVPGGVFTARMMKDGVYALALLLRDSCRLDTKQAAATVLSSIMSDQGEEGVHAVIADGLAPVVEMLSPGCEVLDEVVMLAEGMCSIRRGALLLACAGAVGKLEAVLAEGQLTAPGAARKVLRACREAAS